MNKVLANKKVHLALGSTCSILRDVTHIVTNFASQGLSVQTAAHYGEQREQEKTLG